MSVSKKSYMVLDTHDRAPDRRAQLITYDADFGVCEVLNEREHDIVIAYRESVRGKAKWMNASVARRGIKLFRYIGTQGGECVKGKPAPTWLSGPLCAISTAPIKLPSPRSTLAKAA